MTDALERMLMEIPYASLPEDMIDTITVDVEGMPCGTVLTVGDIPELNSGKFGSASRQNGDRSSHQR